MRKSKRFTLTIITGVLLVFIAILSVFKNMEGIASLCIAGVMTILTTYIWGETKRPSNTESNEK